MIPKSDVYNASQGYDVKKSDDFLGSVNTLTLCGYSMDLQKCVRFFFSYRKPVVYFNSPITTFLDFSNFFEIFVVPSYFLNVLKCSKT